MKTRILSLLMVVTVLFVGCKNESKDEKDLEGDAKTEEVVNDTYTVTLDITVKKDDDFQIYYTDKTSADFSEEQSVWVKVKGSDAPQKVTFTFPKDVLPTLFRLDFGLNNQQQDMILTSIEVEYFGKKFTSSGAVMANYFRPIGETQIDFASGVIKPIVKDGKGVEPVLYPQEVPLEKELKKLIM